MKSFYLLLLLACYGEISVGQSQNVSNEHDIFTQSNYHDVSVYHVEGELTVDFPNKKLVGMVLLFVRFQSDTATSLILDTKHLRIETVHLISEKGHRKSATYHLGKSDSIRGIPLIIPQINDQIKAIEIAYESTPDNQQLVWVDSSCTQDGLHPMLFADPEPIGGRELLPIQDSPQQRFTYNLTLKVPSGMLALMSGDDLPKAISRNGTYHFQLRKRAIPAYLLSLAVGHFSYYSIGKGLGIYCEPTIAQQAKISVTEVPALKHQCEKNWGKFPWDDYSIVFLPACSFMAAAMENPGIMHASTLLVSPDNSMFYVYGHEFGHEYGSNRVGFEQWHDLWINEGLAEYIAWRLAGELHGKGFVEMLMENYLVNVLGENMEKPLRHESLAHPLEAFGSVSYVKGALFFYNVEQLIGKDRMDKFLKKYFQHDSQAFSTEEFLNLLKKELQPNELKTAMLTDWAFGNLKAVDLPDIKSQRLEFIRSACIDWLNGSSIPYADSLDWSSLEWEFCFEMLMKKESGNYQNGYAKVINKLAKNFDHTEYNGVTQAVFLRACIKAGITNKDRDVETYLRKNGRMRAIIGLYKALKEQGRLEYARNVFSQTGKCYHPEVREEVQRILE